MAFDYVSLAIDLGRPERSRGALKREQPRPYILLDLEAANSAMELTNYLAIYRSRLRAVPRTPPK
jgi:hypothetical protein